MESRHILIVDDDEPIRTLLREIFEEEGYRVQTAANGRDALAALTKHQVDVLITDLAMPIMDGRALIHALRAQGSILPVVVMTAGLSLAAAARGVEAAAYVGKPFDLALVVATIERVVGRRS